MTKVRKRILRILLTVAIAPLALMLLLSILLYLPPVQRWAVRQVTAYASQETGLAVSVDEVHLSFPLDLKLGGVRVEEQSNTVLSVGTVLVDLDLSRLARMSIGVDAVELTDGLVHTRSMIPSVSIDGRLERFRLTADAINLRTQKVCAASALLHGADIEVTLHETEEDQDTTSTPAPQWVIGIRRAEISQSHLLLHMPGDSMKIETGIGQALLRQGSIDLAHGSYKAQTFSLKADSLLYDLPFDSTAATGGINPSHIQLGSIHLKADSLKFVQDPMLVECAISQGAAHEQCGLTLDSLAGHVRCTNQDIALSRLSIRTPQSRITGRGRMDFTTFTPHAGGQLALHVQGHIAMQDISAAAGDNLPIGMRNAFAAQAADFRAEANGNMDMLNVDTLALTIPSVADLRAHGHLANLLSADSLGGNMKWDLRTMNLDGVRRWLGLSGVTFPATTLHAVTEMRPGNQVSVDALAAQRNGHARLTLKADLHSMAYHARTTIRDWRLGDWLPQSGLRHLTAQASVKGRGTDFLSKRTSINGQLRIDSLAYKTWNLGNMGLDANLRQGIGQMQLISKNQLIDLLARADVHIQKHKVKASTFSMDLNSLDLHALHLAKDTMKASMKMHFEGSSDLRQTHALDAHADHITLTLKDTIFHPVNLGARLRLSPDSILAEASAGDLELKAASPHGLDSLMAYGQRLWDEIDTEVDSMHLDQEKLKQMLPTLQFHLTCGTRNPVNNFLRSASGYSFDQLHLDLNSCPQTGLKGNGHLYTLNTGAILLDTIQWSIAQDDEGVTLKSRIRNGLKNRVVSFQSTLQARLTSNGTAIHLDYIDAKGKKGVDLGLEANVTAEGIKIHMTPLNPIIAYRRFTLNEDNYIEFSRQGRLLALVDLLADDGTGLKIYSTPNEDAKQDISLSMHNINMAELTSVMPYAPRLGGLLHGDIHYMQADSTTTVSADMGIRKLIYEDTPMGDMGLNAIYFPNSDGSHHVNAVVTQNDNEIAMLAGTYHEEDGQGLINAEATLENLPLSLANAFLPKGTVSLKGATSGILSVSGPTSNPLFTGTLATQSMHVLAEDYSVDLTIPDDTLHITGSHLDFDRIEAYAAGNSPLTLDGSVDFSDLERIKLSVDINAKNYKLIDAPQSHTALTYGKVYVDMSARAWGTLDNLKVRGQLTVLGNTDVTYVLRDSPITVKDQLSDIVTFCDFSDTTHVQPIQKRGQSVDALIVLSVEQAAQVHCMLSENGSDYVDLQGGGELTLTYDLENDMRLYGRYTIEQGMMRYSIMAIPLNDFKIQSGSYVEFTGNVSNPTLGISASERVKASVTENDVPRNVAFDVGLALSKTLEDMGLAFTLDAPEDMTVQNELSAMSVEERGRVAVTMLVTGMYMTDDFNFKSGFSYANTLNAYLQSAINNIAGQALSTVDLSFGIENSTTASGGTTTDYSFSFRKRFWGNRISLVLGGKVSSGSEAENNGQTIIDNVSLEYKLDNGASRYVRLYYDRNHQSLIEGELTEMGAGLVLRRRTNRLRDLFRFRKQPNELPMQSKSQKTGSRTVNSQETVTQDKKEK